MTTHGTQLLSKQAMKLIFLLFLCFCAERCQAIDGRKVTSEINPGCPSCTENYIIHSVSLGAEDALHHLWGFVGAPAFIMVKTKPDAKMNIDWASLMEGKAKSISFDPSPLYVFGMALPNIIKYNDDDDSGALNSASDEQEIFPMTNFTWNKAEVLANTEQRVEIKSETTSFKDQPLNNSIIFQLSCSGSEGRNTLLPRLLETPTSSQLDIILDNLKLDIESNSSRSFNDDNARWAFEMILFTNNPMKEEFIKSSSKSLSDEYAPGIFELDELVAPVDGSDNIGGYLQWRPVSYLKDAKRDVNYATMPNINTTFSPLSDISPSIQKSLVYALLGDDLVDVSSVSTDLSFGRPGDGYYKKYSYTTWTVALGYGTPPEETFSTLVIVIICVGVGLPTLMFIIGGIVVAYRKLNQSRDSPLIGN